MNDAVNSLTRKRKLRNVLMMFLVALIIIAILFVAAGNLAWVWGWWLAGIMIAANIFSICFLDPGLIDERTGVKSGAKRWDIVLASIIGRFGPLAAIIISGLDFRYGWSQPVPLPLSVFGLAFLILSYALIFWAMRENRFFSSIVRIQQERGHHVITTGPYRIVRHPGYLGSVIFLLALPFALASYWALLPAIGTSILLCIRIVLEENTLKRELEGYAEYAKKVRYRIIPGIW